MVMKVKFKNKIFKIKPLALKNITSLYVKKTSNEFINYKKNTIRDQKNYVRKIRKEGNEIYEITNGKKLVATSGFQFLKSKTFQGVLIVDPNFIGKGFAKYIILSSILYVNKTLGKNFFYVNIEKKNISSIKMCTGAGYRIYKRNKVCLKLFFNLNKNPNKIKIIIK